ncbi:MAG: ABC transporter ATP-binding protein [Oscillospiraceae bacterium]|nr:ABC transporter ATP-binding protein [Oscillospiraceae bacterium]
MSGILECKALVKRYLTKEALGGIDLALEPGRIVGLLGPNGSGKTTLIKLACGLLTPTSGEILIDGEKPSRYTNSIVSYLPERIALPLWMTTAKALDFYADFYADFRRDAAEDMVQRLGLESAQTIRAMSKGTREKLQLILTMSRAAKLYLLDEPIGGVDPATRDYILKTILTNYSEDSTVLISTHLITDVEHVLDEAVFLREGSIVLHESVDTIREEKGKSVDELFREMFAC